MITSEDQQQLLHLRQEHEQVQSHQQAPAVELKECVYKTKPIQFLGRTTPIVLQNDNGPCPLLAIGNVLLLRNNLHISPDIAEVSQEKLLSLVAERLIDSNSNIGNKDAGYAENQQQNISDAIDLLPRLTTGIDVNIKFKRIDDFEFTPECAIFDLLDIPLYHGWIVDSQAFQKGKPYKVTDSIAFYLILSHSYRSGFEDTILYQDEATANAIGSKSYNAITSELVSLETRNMKGKRKCDPEEDCIDFAAATTATLGVPSPCLSKTRSFDESPSEVSGSPSPRTVSDHQTMRKGDLEEAAELMRVMKMSEVESPMVEANSLAGNGDDQSFHQPEASVPDDSNASSSDKVDIASFKNITGEVASSSLKTADGNHTDRSVDAENDVPVICKDVLEKRDDEIQYQSESSESLSLGKQTMSVDSNHTDISRGPEKISQFIIAPDSNESVVHQNTYNTTELSGVTAPDETSGSSSGRMQHVGAPEALTPNVDDNEPIYEGEECILESRPTTNENREPVYEGEVVLAEQSNKTILDSCNVKSNDEITPEQGELIRNFLKNSASQLTFSGLFSLQDGLKERELCVFFRNNHFSTMFKYEGELYLLATDQGYINEPDLVWEKLNEVNGDTIFMTSSFREFKVESHATETWSENNVMTSTADYLASIDSASQAGLDMNSDLQLAIALQQQEFEQQPQRQSVQQPTVSGGSRMVTGPQVARNTNRRPTSSSSRPEPKSKDKCTVM